MTLVNIIIQFYNTPSVHYTVCSPPQVKSPSFTIYALTPSSNSPLQSSHCPPWAWVLSFFSLRFYLILERGEGREKERDRNINVWLLLTHPLLGTWATSQVCALTGNQTSNSLVHSLSLNPLSHTSQGLLFFMLFFFSVPPPLLPSPQPHHWPAVSLLYIYESVSISLISSVCSLESA